MKNRLFVKPKHLKKLSIMIAKMQEQKEQEAKGILKKIKRVFK